MRLNLPMVVKQLFGKYLFADQFVPQRATVTTSQDFSGRFVQPIDLAQIDFVVRSVHPTIKRIGAEETIGEPLGKRREKYGQLWVGLEPVVAGPTKETFLDCCYRG